MKKPALLIAPMAFVLVFFVLPVGNTFANFLRPSELFDVLGNRSMLAVMWFSTWQAVVSTFATLAIGIPATWALSRFRFRGARIAHGILSAPFLLPSVVVAAGVLAINDSRGVLPIIWAHVIFNVAVVLRVVGPAGGRPTMGAARRASGKCGLNSRGRAITGIFPRHMATDFTSHGECVGADLRLLLFFIWGHCNPRRSLPPHNGIRDLHSSGSPR